MKKFVLAVAVAALAAPSFAGSLAPVVAEPTPAVIEQDTGSSAGGYVVPLLFLLLLALAASQNRA
jgi:hypothetical protein